MMISVSVSTNFQTAPTIMFLVPTLEIGGAEAMLDLLIGNPGERSFRPVVCCTYRPGPIGERLKSRGITVYDSLASNKLDFRIVARLLKIIKKEKVVMIYDVFSGNNTLFFGLLVSRLTRTPFFNAVHNARLHPAMIMLLQSVCMKFSDGVIALTQHHREFLSKHYHIERSKTRVIPNGVDVNRFFTNQSDISSYRNQLGLLIDSPLVAIIATLRPLKGHKIFLQAAQKILMDCPKTQFLVVGNGSEMDELEHYANQLGIRASVHFLGERTDIPEILSCIDISVLSSYQETFPVAILEAMAASKPVVATNVGFLDELIRDRETGFLVMPGDPKSLADAIITLIKKSDLAKKMGTLGRIRVEEYYSLQKTISAFENVISECTHNKPL